MVGDVRKLILSNTINQVHNSKHEMNSIYKQVFFIIIHKSIFNQLNGISNTIYSYTLK